MAIDFNANDFVPWRPIRGNHRKELKMSRTTEVGKFIKVLRVRNNERVADMALKIGVSPSYLSSVENTQRKLNNQTIRELIRVYNLPESEQIKLLDARVRSEHNVNLTLLGASNIKTDMVCELSRKFNTLSDNACKKILQILKEDK